MCCFRQLRVTLPLVCFVFGISVLLFRPELSEKISHAAHGHPRFLLSISPPSHSITTSFRLPSLSSIPCPPSSCQLLHQPPKRRHHPTCSTSNSRTQNTSLTSPPSPPPPLPPHPSPPPTSYPTSPHHPSSTGARTTNRSECRTSPTPPRSPLHHLEKKKRNSDDSPVSSSSWSTRNRRRL